MPKSWRRPSIASNISEARLDAALSTARRNHRSCWREPMISASAFKLRGSWQLAQGERQLKHHPRLRVFGHSQNGVGDRRRFAQKRLRHPQPVFPHSGMRIVQTRAAPARRPAPTKIPIPRGRSPAPKARHCVIAISRSCGITERSCRSMSSRCAVCAVPAAGAGQQFHQLRAAGFSELRFQIALP